MAEKSEKNVKISLLLRENLINCLCKLFHALHSGTFKIFRPSITGPKSGHKSHSFAHFTTFTGNILAERLRERFKI